MLIDQHGLHQASYILSSSHVSYVFQWLHQDHQMLHMSFHGLHKDPQMLHMFFYGLHQDPHMLHCSICLSMGSIKILRFSICLSKGSTEKLEEYLLCIVCKLKYSMLAEFFRSTGAGHLRQLSRQYGHFLLPNNCCLLPCRWTRFTLKELKPIHHFVCRCKNVACPALANLFPISLLQHNHFRTKSLGI